ncbi:hypothetical protein L1987_03024 [Smallanthus sonchifolius]|uniref:Uncharacterized protein n=1 Tax=Smallanthus sonchifolius TaxID=185202 RepID=A0ACB9K9K1_9ASTR|nr:hypothetical protein L1987_03024 [Smallanthus sonchifolius]
MLMLSVALLYDHSVTCFHMIKKNVKNLKCHFFSQQKITQLEVSVLAPNVPALYEMHFAVPMAGAILNTMNTRLDAKNIAAIMKRRSSL